MANSAPSSDHKELKAQWQTTPKVPTVTLADVQKHKSADDLWIVIHGKVYDVTVYARDHPGGAEALVEVAGQDATSAYEDVGHSEDAREIMNGFLVGVLNEPLAATQKKATVKLVSHGDSQSHASTTSTLLTPRNELISFAAGTVLLVWALQHIRIGDVLSASVPKSLGHQHGPGFTSGFMLASTTCAAVGIMGFRYFNNETARRFGGDFTSYPAHIPVSHLVAESSRPGGVLKAQVYQKFPLVQKVELAKDIYRFVFQLPHTTSVLGLPIGQHVAIRGYFKDEEGEHTITRSYTPVSNNSDLGRLELVIRCYPDGKLTGKYLSQLKIGDEVEFRGPKGAMTYRKSMSKKVGMVAGGTGITPMFQLIRTICEDKSDDTEVSLIYANRSESDILLKHALDRYARENPKKFKVFYMLDSAGPSWTGGVGHVTIEELRQRMPKPSVDSKVLLCGPPGLVNATKKSLGRLGFEQPGAVSRMTDQIFCF